MRFQRSELPLKLDRPAEAREFLAGCFANADPALECLWVAHLDERCRCIHLSRHVGDEDGARFPLRSIIADAAAHGTAGIILAHNHPSGDPSPSSDDCRATKRLASAAAAIDCALLDHFVFSGERCTSLRSLGLL